VDAHLFRRFCDALLPALTGARVGKIYQPGRDVTSFSLYGLAAESSSGRPEKLHLVLRAGPREPFLFVTPHRVPARARPPDPVMRLRKYVSERFIAGAVSHWTERRLFLEISGRDPLWLCLDLREGPSLLFEAPPPFAPPAWPDDPFSALAGHEAWREWPVLTPALRRALSRLEPEEGAALLMDLQNGGGDVFLYENEAGQRKISAWPLPPEPPSCAGNGGVWRESVWESPLRALALAGESLVYGGMADRARQEAARPYSAEAGRLSRLRAKLDREEERLLDLCSRKRPALLLQASLYLFRPDERRASVRLDSEDGPLELALDPRLTVRENMAALFRQAGKGGRGLEHLRRRRAALDGEKAALAEAMLRRAASPDETGRSPSAPGKAPRLPDGMPGRVQAFRSSDGFLILRGRDGKGNMLALKIASPHDYWLHVAQGPGAHVVIRRDHAGHDVPERTMREAGVLAALKSRLADGEGAEILYALAKHVSPVKKAVPGTVNVAQSGGTFRVDPDPGLEERLRAAAPPQGNGSLKG
jgi:predicted ribosome quality control (RQC) complex YloA/Tae2 family protein